MFLKYLSHRAFSHDLVTYKQLRVTYVANMFAIIYLSVYAQLRVID